MSIYSTKILRNKHISNPRYRYFGTVHLVKVKLGCIIIRGYTTVHLEPIEQYQSNLFFIIPSSNFFDVLDTYQGTINNFLYEAEFLDIFAELCFFSYLHAQHTKNEDYHRRADGKFLLSPSLTFFSQRNMSTNW